MSRVADDLTRHQVTGIIEEWPYCQYLCATCEQRPARVTMLLASTWSDSGRIEADVCGRCARQIREHLDTGGAS